MTIAVLFDMFGPYHLARLNGLGVVEPTVGIEINARCRTYDWERMETESRFKRRTLFNEDDSSQLTARQIISAVWAELDRARPDVVFVPGWISRGALAALRWSLSRGVPAVVMSESTRSDRKRVAWREIAKRRVVGLYGAGLVGGRPQRDYLVSLGMPIEHIALGYNVVDNAYFTAASAAARTEPKATRARIGVPSRFFLASARFIPIKNLLTLLDGYAAFRKRRPDSNCALVLLGDGGERSAIEAKRVALGLNDWVLLPGFKQYDELPSYYGLAEAFAHVSRIEPWGLVVNEAMASGLPVIVSSACGSATDLVKPGGNGFLIEHDDVAAIADAFAKLHDDPALSRRMATRSENIIADWGPERFAQGALEASRIATQSGAQPYDLPTRGVLASLSLV